MAKKIRTVLLISLFIFSLFGCNNENDSRKEDVQLSEATVEFVYYDIINGSENTYKKSFEPCSLSDLINDWIMTMDQNGVEYGMSEKGTNVLNDLSVNYVILNDTNVIIDFNRTFLEFDNVESQVGYFIIGLERILKQTTSAISYSITIEGSTEKQIIHPDGIMISNVELK